MRISGKLISAALVLFVSFGALSAAAKKDTAKKKGEPVKEAFALKTEQDSVSYAIGLSVGKDFISNKLDINAEVFFQAVRDQYAGKPVMNEEQIKTVMMAFQQKMQAKMAETKQAEGMANLQAGQAYLETVKKDDSFKAFPNGIYYKVLVEGNGAYPDSTSTVECHYSGKTINGEEFDSSYLRNEPIEFPVNGVIPGWQYILPKMKVGSKWTVVIPSDLAYGPNGAGQAIGPNQTLIFDMELLSIKPKTDK